MIDRFTEAYGRAKAGVGDVLGAAGATDTVDALRSAEVEHLLIVEDPDSEAQAWIGPEPIHLGLTVEDLTALGSGRARGRRGGRRRCRDRHRPGPRTRRRGY